MKYIIICLLGIAAALAGDPYDASGGRRGNGTNPWGDSTAYTRTVSLDVAHDYFVKWEIDSIDITFTLTVKTLGWIGFGLSSNGGMTGSDVIMGWVKDGATYFSDRHASGEVVPTVDDSQDWTLLSASENDTHTVMTVRRPLDTCDPDDKVVQPGTVRLIYSFGLADPEGDENTMNVQYHGGTNRGSMSVFLTADRPPKPELPADSFEVDFVLTKTEVPATDTTYWCELFKIPDLVGKHHTIKISPLVEKGNEGFVHHMLMFACRGRDGDDHVGYREACRHPNMPDQLKRCNEIIYAWGVGGVDFYFPEEAGFSLGGDSDPNYFILEVHYDNPGLKNGLSDTSGVKFVVTPTLRKYDSGLLLHGHRYDGPFQIIPPHYPLHTSYGHCPGECTEQAMRDHPDGIYIFATFLHTHILGKSIRLRQFRDGSELPMISRDEEYDFNLQETRHIYPAVNLKPGDDMLVECDYTSEKRQEFTTSGLSTSEEMCLGLTMYYPRVPLTLCESYTDYAWVLKQLTDVTETEYLPNKEPYYFAAGPDEFSGKSYIEILKNEDWTNRALRDKFQALVDRAPMRVNCASVGGNYAYEDEMMDNTCVEHYEEESQCSLEEMKEPRCQASGSSSKNVSTFFATVIFVVVYWISL